MNKTLVEKATNLNALLKVLAAVDDDNAEAVRELPRVIQLASEYSDSLLTALIDDNSDK